MEDMNGILIPHWFDRLSMIAYQIAEELSKITEQLEDSQHEIDVLYEKLEESGEQLEQALFAYRKAINTKELLDKKCQKACKDFHHGQAIQQALYTRDPQKIQAALSYIYTDREGARYELARAALGADYEIKQNIFDYYDVLYQRALLIGQEDIQKAYKVWMEAKKALFKHSFETLIEAKSKVQHMSLEHKRIMKAYEEASLQNAQNSVRQSELKKNSLHIEHLQLAFQY